MCKAQIRVKFEFKLELKFQAQAFSSIKKSFVTFLKTIIYHEWPYGFNNNAMAAKM